MSYENFHFKIKEIKDSIIPTQNLKKGISIIIPVYNGIEYIESCLESLEKQEINNANFEVILVLNGVFIQEFKYLHSVEFHNLDIITLINDDTGAGSARNLGMKNAKYSHVTFIDIDDHVSPNFIQANFDNMEKNTITFSQIHDVVDGEIISDNLVNKDIIDNHSKDSVPLLNLNRIATITVCKVIPKEIIVLQKFRDNLRSGEDTVFFSELFVNSRPKLKVLPLEEKSIYYRRIRPDSVSRKNVSYDFLVFQRLEILEILDRILNEIKNPTLKKFIKSKYNAQISFMNKYLVERPDEREKVLNAVNNMSFDNFNYSTLNRNFAKTLVLSYCFPPYSDTSATIVAKRLVNNNEVVDVISNNMSRIRDEEPSLKKMVAPLVGKNVLVNQMASFSNMFYLNSYIDTAVLFYAENKGTYSKIYSRAMFPISHLPNIFIKIMDPDINWVAEFSDPLLYNIESIERHALIDNETLVNSLKNGLLGRFSKYVDDNLFNIAELIPFSLADELIFTNRNQLEYMISRFSEDEKQYLRNKSEIIEQPTLPKEYYNIDKAELSIEPAVVNIAYFGNFYSKRSYNQFIKLVKQLNENFNLIFKLYLYTNISQFEESELVYLTENNVGVNNYLPYTQFLNASTQFDILLISDADTKDDKPYNPYLPSKLSDYLGSEAVILALTEKSSIMSQKDRDKLFKIDMVQFEEEIKSNSLFKNQTLISLIELVKENKIEKKDRNIIYNQDTTILHDRYTETVLTNDLNILNVSNKNWLIKPKKLPIKKENKYEIVISNNSSFEKEIEIKSFYSLKNVIEVDFILIEKNEKSVETICISELRKNFIKKQIPVKSNLMIKVKYSKNYKKIGFINAGRLQIRGI